MTRATIAAHAVAVLALLASSATGADSLPAETAKRLKEATVYVKVSLGGLELSGSGFVIQLSGDGALIVTNRHVIAKPQVLEPGTYIPGLRGRDRMTLHRAQRALRGAEPVVTVVFNSGEINEEASKAEVLCQLDDPDLAILKVARPKSTLAVIEFQNVPQPVETMPVFILGFPFGDTLSANQKNPNITIGKGSVSSIRKDQAGKLAKVQIDGALNPGNSGGPVVDAEGRLIGVAVQTIQGSNIGLAIPAGALSEVLAGSLGKPAISVSPAVNQAKPKYEIALPLIDPFGKLKSATVYFVAEAVSPDPARVGQAQLPSRSGSRRLPLQFQNRAARAELPLLLSGGQPPKEITVQVSFVNEQGTTVFLDPQVISVPAPVQATVTVDAQADGQGTTTTITQTETNGNGVRTSRRQMTVTRGGSAGKKPDPAAPKSNGRFKLGDKVQVEWAGKTETAEVVGFAGTGWIEVAFERDGIRLTPVFPPHKVMPLAGSKKKSAGPQATMRTWTSKGGKHKMQAKFVELSDDAVTLQKEDGKTVSVPLDKLTESDQALARKLADTMEDNPFESNTDGE